jgi:hypothetical protein
VEQLSEIQKLVESSEARHIGDYRNPPRDLLNKAFTYQCKFRYKNMKTLTCQPSGSRLVEIFSDINWQLIGSFYSLQVGIFLPIITDKDSSMNSLLHIHTITKGEYHVPRSDRNGIKLFLKYRKILVK